MELLELLIDTHHHLWKFNPRDYVWMTEAMDDLRQDFLVADLQREIGAIDVGGTVVIQARQTIEETDWLLDIADRDPLILGVVGWVPLHDPGVGSLLQRLVQNKKLKGVRHVLHDEADAFYMLREDFNRGISLLERSNIAYDILIFEHHLPQTIRFVDLHPDQIFIVDHIAKPKIKQRELSPWREGIQKLAKRENVFCKVSGMVTEADWKKWQTAELIPYFDVVLSAFGSKRLMFGSDWPVVRLACSYREWEQTFKAFICSLTATEQEDVCSMNAKRAYNL